MKYLFLILTGWVSFLMTDCSTPQEKGKEERELWNFYADFATDEVLAINGQLFGNCIPAGDNVGFTKTTRVFYSKNDGKYIPMSVESFGKGKKEYSWELSAFFSAKPHEKYTLITEYAVGNIRCKNPDGTKQEFTHVGYDSLIVPTTQLYGTYSHVFSPASQENIIGIYTDTRTKESIAIIRSDKVWHMLV